MNGNAGQKEFWNQAVGQVWAELQDQLDRQLRPLGEAGLQALAPVPGEAVLDIGCGCGDTSFALARMVGETGAVLGLDISEPMLTVAHQRADGLASPSFTLADAQTAELGIARFDAAFSRFGVMFFADPVAAFANIRRMLKPQGRITFVCWRPMAENAWQRVPLDAAKPLLPPQAPSDPLAPGPFAFADPARVTTILAEAGFADIAVEPFDTRISGGDLEQTLSLAMQVGPLSRALREYPAARDAALGVVRDALSAYVTPEGVMMPAAVWIVSAANHAG